MEESGFKQGREAKKYRVGRVKLKKRPRIGRITPRSKLK